jgi:hypothetical protein
VIINRVEDEKMFVRICKVKSSGFRDVEQGGGREDVLKNL